MKNIAGLLVVLGGGFFAIIGLRGTQHAALPGLFPVAPRSSDGSAPPVLPAGPDGQGGADPNDPSLYPGGAWTT